MFRIAIIGAVSVILLSVCTTAPSPSVLESMQGRWTGVFTSVTEVGTTGVKCEDGEGWFEIVGSDLRGKGFIRAYNIEYEVSATVSATGAIEGGFAVRENSIARVWGGPSEGGLSGEFEDTEECKGTWTAVKE